MYTSAIHKINYGHAWRVYTTLANPMLFVMGMGSPPLMTASSNYCAVRGNRRTACMHLPFLCPTSLLV